MSQEDDDGEIELPHKPIPGSGNVLTPDGWRGFEELTPPSRIIFREGDKWKPQFRIETKGKTSVHARILAIGQMRIDILEKKAADAKLQVGIDYGKYLTALKEVQIFFNLIREIKI